jgi:hypothetical protein
MRSDDCRWGRTVFIIMAILTLLLSACGGGSGGEDTYTISGQVTNDQGPMEGVEVDLTGDLTDTTTTDASGD